MSVVTGKTEENAILLLAACEELGLPQEIVRTTDNGFTAPPEVVDKAFGSSAATTSTEA